MEIAYRPPRIAVRDSKAPEWATLTFPASAFTAFTAHLGTLEALGEE
ncbi:DUF397 domain-containing protein [Streptomyces prasinus]|nr:DUF397 domain-containing protein [Streptomyces prasinus]